ncbi:MAG: phosphate ABC transporter permease subunit PstC [Gemmatimonadetes bacterium]|nr:MAG: phosphate ABC transporter permease subunit PstC [Gemmatimonadota bacterium]
MVGGDARPGPRRAARLRAAAQAARPLDRGALEEHHGRRQVGVDDGSPVAPDRPALVGRNAVDRLYRAALTGLALSLPLLLVALLAELVASAWPAITRFGVRFLWTSVWDPVAGVFGAAPMIFGTLASSLLALLFAVPLALGVAIYLTEFSPKWLRQPVAFLVELLAAIPSVVYGLWGIFVLIPFLRGYVVPPLRGVLGWTPFLQGVFYGNSLLAGGVILAIMIVPYIAAVSREVLLAVPSSQREAALGMGATRWEAVWTAVVPYGRAGLIGAVILGLGRALGETMAVTMLIGNRHDIGLSVLQPAYTMAAAVANEFSEATTNLYLSALFEVGLILFVVTVVVNALARLMIWRVARGTAVGSRAL